MKNDIDFDELDKAVSSLMGGVASSDPTDDEPKQKTLSINTTLKPNERPEYTKVEEAARKIGSETLVTDSEQDVVHDLESLSAPAPTPVVTTPSVEDKKEEKLEKPAVSTRPSSGRFMDVVHPSSIMRTSEKTPVRPDEVADGNQDSDPKPDAITETPQKVDEDLSTAPVASPFLPDAKVEKRPLGASPAPLSDQETNASTDVDDSKADNSSEEPQEIVPINSEASEQDNTGDTQAVLDATSITAHDDVNLQLQSIESDHTELIPPEAAESLRAVESVDTEIISEEHAAVASVETSQAGSTPNAIYDVKEYHQPLGHPAKQKSGWGIVVIIVIIIVIAAAIGVGTYFMLGLGS